MAKRSEINYGKPGGEASRKENGDEISGLWEGEQKDGYLLMWGCGDPTGKPLAYEVMKHPDRIFGWKTNLTRRTWRNLERLDH